MYAISLTTPAQEWLSMSMRKWAALIYIGKRIKEDVLYNRRADYGKQVVKNLSLRLTERYGKGWSEKTLRHCLRAAETFSEADIVSAVQRQFNWIQLKSLMYISDSLARGRRIAHRTYSLQRRKHRAHWVPDAWRAKSCQSGAVLHTTTWQKVIGRETAACNNYRAWALYRTAATGWT